MVSSLRPVFLTSYELTAFQLVSIKPVCGVWRPAQTWYAIEDTTTPCGMWSSVPSGTTPLQPTGVLFFFCVGPHYASQRYYFATASHDRTARLWSTDHIYPLRIFAGHLSDVDVFHPCSLVATHSKKVVCLQCVKFHPNCNYVATGSSDKSIRLWEVNSGNCARIFTGHYGSIYALAFSPDGRLLASAGNDCDAFFLLFSVPPLRFSSLLGSGEDKNVMIWDLGTGKRVKTFSGHHEKCIWSLDFSAEGTLLASGSADSVSSSFYAIAIALLPFNP